MIIANEENPLEQCALHLDKLKANIDALTQLMKSTVRVANEERSLEEWLNTSDAGLRAGFQAAAIGASMEDQLFFLEHLNQYIQYAHEYQGFCDQFNVIKTSGDKSIKIERLYQKITENALQLALKMLTTLWLECVDEHGAFRLNASFSEIVGGDTGFKDLADQGKVLANKITDTLRSLSTKKALQRLEGVSKSLPQEMKDIERVLVLSSMNEATLVLTRLLPKVVGFEGIQQIGLSAVPFEQCKKKWVAEEHDRLPPLWTLEQSLLAKKMKQVGDTLSQHHQKHSLAQQKVSNKRHSMSVSELSSFQNDLFKRSEPNSFSTGALLSPRHLAVKKKPLLTTESSFLSFFSFGQKAGGMDDSLDKKDITHLKTILSPLTRVDVKIYSRMLDQVAALKGASSTELKTKIQTIHSAPSSQKPGRDAFMSSVAQGEKLVSSLLYTPRY